MALTSCCPLPTIPERSDQYREHRHRDAISLAWLYGSYVACQESTLPGAMLAAGGCSGHRGWWAHRMNGLRLWRLTSS